MGKINSKLPGFLKNDNIYNINTNINNSMENNNDSFEDMEEIKEDIYVGIGIKRMKGYKCDLKIDELNKLRENFWENKTNHNSKNWPIWNTIKRAVLFDEYRSNILLKEYNINTVNGCINHLIDSKGNEYRIPNYCINEPYFEKLYFDEKDIIEKKVKLNIHGWKKMEIEVSNKYKGKYLKEEIKIKEQIEDDKIIRLFYRGKEILDDDFLYNHDLNELISLMILIQ